MRIYKGTEYSFGGKFLSLSDVGDTYRVGLVKIGSGVGDRFFLKKQETRSGERLLRSSQ